MEVITILDDLLWMRKIAQVLPPIQSAETLGVPTLDANPSDPDWTSELDIGSADTAMTFGKRALKPWPLAKYIKVSKTLLRASGIPVDGLVRDRLAYKFALASERAYLTGTGANQPLGVFTQDSNGISTARDYSTGNAATAVAYNGLVGCKFNLKAQYRRRNCAWVFHRTLLRDIALLKDGQGRPLWGIPGGYFMPLSVGEPETLLGVPVYESEWAPSTMTASKVVGIIGDFSYYMIADRLTMQLQVLTELYAATNQNAYIGRIETDGMPVHELAFSRLTLAAG